MPIFKSLEQIVVAIDPATTTNEDSDETGIIVAGRSGAGYGYVLEDASGIYTPSQWGHRVVQLYHAYACDRVIAEVNNGGDMVEYVLRTIEPNISYRKVHASRGKSARAEPISALYEQGRVFHVHSFPVLEDQMCNFAPGMIENALCDRVDALVWALTYLMLGHQGQRDDEAVPIGLGTDGGSTWDLG